MDERRQTEQRPKYHHERRDINVRSVLAFGVGLFVLVVAAGFGMKGLFGYLVAQQPRLGPPPSPLASIRQAPPEPRLQVVPAQDLRRIRAEEDELLRSYGWVDQKAGTVRIPIERAMDLLLQRGLPVRAEGGKR